MEYCVEGNNQVIVFKRNGLDFCDVLGVLLDETGSAWMFANGIVEIVAFNRNGHDVPIRLKEAGEFPIDRLSGPDLEDLCGRSIIPLDARPRTKDVKLLLDQRDS